MEDRFDDRWRTDILKSYFQDYPPAESGPSSTTTTPSKSSKLPPALQRRASNQPAATGNMLTAPPLEKSDSQWSPMSSGLVTPQDSISGCWGYSPSDSKRRGSSGLYYGQNSNRWSLGTQLSSVSFSELPSSKTLECDEESKESEWSTIEHPVFEEEDTIFHPDDEIIIDTKDPSDPPIKRASIGTRPNDWPSNGNPAPTEPVPTIEPRFRQIQPAAPLPPKQDRQILKISTTTDPSIGPLDPEISAAPSRTSIYSFNSDASKYHSFNELPKVTNRRSFVESPVEVFNGTEVGWPLPTPTQTTQPTNYWIPEKSLPPTPRSRGVSLSLSRRGLSSDEFYSPQQNGSNRASMNHSDSLRSSLNPDSTGFRTVDHPSSRPASWNPRAVDSWDINELNFDKAILGTSLARDHRLQARNGRGSGDDSVDDGLAFESIFNGLKVSDTIASNRSSLTSMYNRNYTWNNGNEFPDANRTSTNTTSHQSKSEQVAAEAQRHRSVMNRIVNERGLNPAQFDVSPKHARYFVIKSYNEDDVHKSLKFNIWASTEIGNRRLDKAYRESHRAGPIYLFFSVNASGQFCGMARMMSPVDYTTSSSVWTQTDKWKGRMDVRWIFVKDIPNSHLRHIRVWSNENKPVTNSRDTQELPPDAGLAMLRIFWEYPPKTSVILSNLATAEIKEEAAMNSDDSGNEVGQRHTSLRSSDEFGRLSDSAFPRQSWHSGTTGLMNDVEPRTSRQSFPFDQHHPSLSRRNTISAPNPAFNALAPATNQNRMSTSSTPTSGMRNQSDIQEELPTAYFPPAPLSSRFHESATTSTYRNLLSGFAGLGDVYGGSHSRYPPFQNRNSGGAMNNSSGHYRYDEEIRYL